MAGHNPTGAAPSSSGNPRGAALRGTHLAIVIAGGHGSGIRMRSPIERSTQTVPQGRLSLPQDASPGTGVSTSVWYFNNSSSIATELALYQGTTLVGP